MKCNRFAVVCTLAVSALAGSGAHPAFAQTSQQRDMMSEQMAQMNLKQRNSFQAAMDASKPRVNRRAPSSASRLPGAAEAVLDVQMNDYRQKLRELTAPAVLSLPPSGRGPGDKIPSSKMVYGLKHANGRMWGTDRRGRLLVALSPRAVLVQSVPPRNAAPHLP